MMNKFSIKNILCLPMIILLFTACVTHPPKRMESRFGNAFGMSKAQQTVNPDASLNTAPVRGIDGQAGDAIFDNYRESYTAPKPPARGVLDIGTSGGSSRTGAQ